jgi:hypothetical protein
MKAKLTQLESNHNVVRTKEIIAHSWNEPRVGRYFSASASPLKPGMFMRIFNSSKVLSVEKKGNTYFFSLIPKIANTNWN